MTRAEDGEGSDRRGQRPKTRTCRGESLGLDQIRRGTLRGRKLRPSCDQTRRSDRWLQRLPTWRVQFVRVKPNAVALILVPVCLARDDPDLLGGRSRFSLQSASSRVCVARNAGDPAGQAGGIRKAWVRGGRCVASQTAPVRIGIAGSAGARSTPSARNRIRSTPLL